jgi:hypothetical protein
VRWEPDRYRMLARVMICPRFTTNPNMNVIAFRTHRAYVPVAGMDCTTGASEETLLASTGLWKLFTAVS